MTRLEQLKEELKEAIKHETPDWFYGNPYLDKLKYAIKKEEELMVKQEQHSQLEAMKAKEPTSEKTVGDKPLEKDFER